MSLDVTNFSLKKEKILFKKQDEREVVIDRDLPSTDLFPKWPHSQSWARPRSRARNFIWVFHMGIGVQTPEPSSAVFPDVPESCIGIGASRTWTSTVTLDAGFAKGGSSPSTTTPSTGSDKILWRIFRVFISWDIYPVSGIQSHYTEKTASSYFCSQYLEL